MEQTLHTELRTLFEEKYYSITEIDYYWTAKDASHLKQLITKLTFYVNQKNQNYTQDDIKNAYCLILDAIIQIPQLKWQRENFNLAIINSKLNDIISIIKANGIKKDRSANIRKAIEHEIQRRGLGSTKQ